MPDTGDDKVLRQQKKGSIETFIGALMPSARMVSLYKPGHPAILPIAARVTNLLLKTLGQDTTLVVDIKGKTVSVDEEALAETKDINAFGGALHTLGIGQVLFTNRLTGEGVYEFLKVLLLKADEKKNLTSIQQELQKLKIAGLLMSFVTSVVDSGETGIADQEPGRLSEEQVLAFTRAETLQDLLLLLFRQNEPLTGKIAESVTAFLDDALNRAISLEQFQASMLWDFYDPRIRACWDRFMQKQERAAKSRGKGPFQKWDRNSVISQAGLFRDADLEVLRVRTTQGKPEAIRFALETIHGVLQNASIQVQAKLALMAYGRVLRELGNDGDIRTLFSEFKKWQEPKPLSGIVMKIMGEKVLSPVLAKNIVIHMSGQEEKTAGFAEIEDLVAVLGLNSIPLFMEELRELADIQNRRKLCRLLTSLCKRLQNVQFLVPVLSDPDWFLVRNAVLILGDVNLPGTAKLIAPALRHEHERVREETIRSLGKIGDAAAVDALASFIAKCDDPGETSMAVTALSLQPKPGIDEKLIQAFNGTGQYDTRVAIAAALSRVVTPASIKFLSVVAKKSFMEMITGRNKELRKAAQESFDKARGARTT